MQTKREIPHTFKTIALKYRKFGENIFVYPVEPPLIIPVTTHDADFQEHI